MRLAQISDPMPLPDMQKAAEIDPHGLGGCAPLSRDNMLAPIERAAAPDITDRHVLRPGFIDDTGNDHGR